jgi:hypothetical protein
MNTFKSFLVCSAFVLLATSCNLFQPAVEKFGFRAGDYTEYQNVILDTAGNAVSGSTTRSTRIVVRTGVSIGGQTDAALVVDSNFTAAGGLSNLDTTYYRVANDEVFYYFDLGAIAQIAGGLGGGGAVSGTAISGFTPAWVKLGETKDAAGTADFPSTDIAATITAQPFGAIGLVAKFTGRNQGATNVTIGANTYRAHRQTQTFSLTASLPVVGRLQISTPVVYDLGVPAQNSTPRTIIRTEQKAASFTLPILGTTVIPGSRTTLVSFRAGSTF